MTERTGEHITPYWWCKNLGDNTYIFCCWNGSQVRWKRIPLTQNLIMVGDDEKAPSSQSPLKQHKHPNDPGTDQSRP